MLKRDGKLFWRGLLPVCEDVFELLTSMSEKKDHKYDYIILDPPAFTKSRQTVESAGRGYKEINLKAMKLLPRGPSSVITVHEIPSSHSESKM